MKSTISILLSNGSPNHNSRTFVSSNTDPEKINNNIEFINRDIREVYDEIFSEAVSKYNASHKKNEITSYYDKVSKMKRTQLFQEIIVQIGNRDDMGILSENAETAKKILSEYYYSFVERNKTLVVFSSFLHMDESTPHLHIDFIPVGEGYKNGLEKRVSLLKALLSLGINRGNREETEWKIFQNKEKIILSDIMQKYGIEWTITGHEIPMISMLEFKKEQRNKELNELTASLDKKKKELDFLTEEIKITDNDISEIRSQYANLNTDPSFGLPLPDNNITAVSYKKTYADPLIDKLKKLLTEWFLVISSKIKEIDSLRYALNTANEENKALNEENDSLKRELADLKNSNRTIYHYQGVLGKERIFSLCEKEMARLKLQKSCQKEM